VDGVPPPRKRRTAGNEVTWLEAKAGTEDRQNSKHGMLKWLGENAVRLFVAEDAATP